MKKTLIIFLSLTAVFVLALAVLIALNGKAELHLALTHGYLERVGSREVNDVFFKYLTEMGAWVPFVIAALLLLWRVKEGLYLLVSEGVTALMVYPLKRLFAEPRPKLFFQEAMPDVTLHSVEGVSMHLHNSFPSGHTATVFCAMLCLSVICRKRPWLSVLFFLIAVLTGYSRIYLSQHFANDVLAGTIVGTVAALLCTWWYTKWRGRWTDYSVVEKLRRNR